MNVAAVLVGINTYPGAPLRGCVNDVMITRDILIKKYLVPAQHIRMLTDSRATKANIEERLEWLVACDAEIKFFWYSGHGAQYPNQNYVEDYEVDGQDELICPVDFDWDGTWINDDYFSVLFNKNKSGKVISIFDCCHSGTMNRSSLKQQYIRPRAIPTPPDILSRDSSIELSSATGLSNNIDDLFMDTSERVTNNVPTIKTKIIQNAPDNLVMLTGCQDNQTSADAYIGGRYQGALSYAIQKSLMQDLKIKYTELYKRVNRVLKQGRFTQQPNLVGTTEAVAAPFLQ